MRAMDAARCHPARSVAPRWAVALPTNGAAAREREGEGEGERERERERER